MRQPSESCSGTVLFHCRGLPQPHPTALSHCPFAKKEVIFTDRVCRVILLTSNNVLYGEKHAVLPNLN